MGTSKDVRGPKGPKWTRLRTDATRYAKGGGGREGAGRLVRDFIDAMGGAAGFIAATPSTTRTTGRLAGFLGAAEDRGVGPALEDLGLEDLAGKPRLEVISGLADAFAGPGSSQEEAPARRALVEVLNDFVPEDGSLADLAVGPEVLRGLIEQFLALDVYYRLDLWVALQLARHADPAEKQRVDQDLRDFIVGMARLELREIDVLHLTADSPEIEQIRAKILTELEKLGQ